MHFSENGREFPDRFLKNLLQEFQRVPKTELPVFRGQIHLILVADLPRVPVKIAFLYRDALRAKSLPQCPAMPLEGEAVPIGYVTGHTLLRHIGHGGNGVDQRTLSPVLLSQKAPADPKNQKTQHLILNLQGLADVVGPAVQKRTLRLFFLRKGG